LWSSILLAGIVSFRGEWKVLWSVVRNGRNVRYLAAGSILIASNWLIFIYAVASGQTLQASLGYFINPLLSVALGMIFLGERLRGWQWWALLIARTSSVVRFFAMIGVILTLLWQVAGARAAQVYSNSFNGPVGTS